MYVHYARGVTYTSLHKFMSAAQKREVGSGLARLFLSRSRSTYNNARHSDILASSEAADSSSAFPFSNSEKNDGGLGQNKIFSKISMQCRVASESCGSPSRPSSIPSLINPTLATRICAHSFSLPLNSLRVSRRISGEDLLSKSARRRNVRKRVCGWGCADASGARMVSSGVTISGGSAPASASEGEDESWLYKTARVSSSAILD